MIKYTTDKTFTAKSEEIKQKPSCFVPKVKVSSKDSGRRSSQFSNKLVKRES